MTKIISGKVLTKVGISKPNFPNLLNEYTALWDTGSVKTFISEKVVTEQNLSFIRTDSATLVDGTPLSVNIYECLLVISGHSTSIRIEVATFKKRPECDVIIGMDIIRFGKFLIENENFSFEIKNLL